jgi:multicomponent Na+:H+ antiporter subunit B
MNRTLRRWLFIPGFLGFIAMLIWGLHGLPPVGHYRGPYGDMINARTAPLRHATDAVTAVNFDFRGFDTLGEEFILFTSIMGVLLLLRQQRDQTPTAPVDKAPSRFVTGESEAVRVLGLMLVGPIVLFGVYVVVHGQLTPGGGFQGGVILASGVLMIYLAGDYETYSALASRHIAETAEAIGAGGYILVGLAGVIWGTAFLQNVLPLGKIGSPFSAGTVALIDASVGLEVGAGFVLLSLAYLEETLARRMRTRK